MALWCGLGQAATVAQLVGVDVGGLIYMIMQAAVTAQQNKKECEQLARRVFTIAELLQHLQDPEVLRRPEIRRPLAGLDNTLREAHELVMACQEKSAVYRLVMAGRQADRFRDVQSRIDSYLLLFPVISHIVITRRLDRIYNILLPNEAAGASTSASSMPPIPAPATQVAAKMVWKEPHGVKEFTFKELATATNNFSLDRKIGEGGFGSVYMGRLPDGREEVFMAEMTILSSIRYKHIVPLYGYCVLVQEKRQLLPPFRKKEKKERLLIYEYMENRSLDLHLHGSSSSPVTESWKTRIEILLGVSRAIEYLQSCGERPVIHRDFKPSNILLDASWAPHLADFGLALTWEGGDTENSEEWEEREKTQGECEEEEKNTVERKEEESEEWEEEEMKTEEWNAVLRSGHRLSSFVLPRIEAGELRMVLDRRPAAEPTPRQLEAVELVAQTAARCLRLQWEQRPAISEVVANLEMALELARCDG
ncbi:hypothetical protein E2562_019727 [Oryza meyeriana var. granulata]|uniref:Protein kinase domain-containing protein n=1 Tax=Oryza meyeriana var. granulata TaxID=110450 RepID=A0A6G1C6H2_9ORYZ|nr:hypothetical protein E2562_019727 [Oryza meyeriana var. granulata]